MNRVHSLVGLPPSAYWYLATPYSKYPGGPSAGFEAASRLAGYLMKAGVRVFCPIAHSHPIAGLSGIDPLSHDFWLPVDEPMMLSAHGLIVAMLPTWQDSHGMAVEIAHFTAANKPIHFLPTEVMEELANAA